MITTISNNPTLISLPTTGFKSWILSVYLLRERLLATLTSIIEENKIKKSPNYDSDLSVILGNGGKKFLPIFLDDL